MLTETEITLSFPMGAGPFRQSPSIFIYRQILRLIHQISCMNTQNRCKECPLHSDCRYYWITGSHFSGYSGVLCPASPFEKRKFSPGEEWTVRIYWIGAAGDFAPMADAALSRMEQKMMGSFFYLKGIHHRVLKEDHYPIRKIRFVTPVQLQNQQENPNEEFDHMNSYYRKWYQTEFQIPYSGIQICPGKHPEVEAFSFETRAVHKSETEQDTSKNTLISELLKETDAGDPFLSDSLWIPGIQVEGTPVSLGTRKLTVKGRTGILYYTKEQTISSVWSLIGLGKTNCIGGGQFETDHTI